MGRLFSGFGALQKCGFPIYELQIKLGTLGLGDQEPFGGFLICELLIKLATFWLGGTRTLLDQPANQPAPQSASQPAKRKTGLFYPRSASLGLFGPLCPMVGPTNGRSNGPMVRPMVGPMVPWSVQWPGQAVRWSQPSDDVQFDVTRRLVARPCAFEGRCRRLFKVCRRSCRLCLLIHTYIHTHIHAYIHPYIHAYIYMQSG